MQFLPKLIFDSNALVIKAGTWTSRDFFIGGKLSTSASVEQVYWRVLEENDLERREKNLPFLKIFVTLRTFYCTEQHVPRETFINCFLMFEVQIKNNLHVLKKLVRKTVQFIRRDFIFCERR